MARPPIRSRLTLPDNPADVRVTDFDAPLIPPRFDAQMDTWRNRNKSTIIPFQLVAGVSTRALPFNPRRSGLQIQNLDGSANISYSLGNDLQANGLRLLPNGTALYDFTTPPDELYLFCVGSNAYVVVLEITRMIDPPRAIRR